MTACRKQSPPAVRAGIYTRISADPSGQRAGVDASRPTAKRTARHEAGRSSRCSATTMPLPTGGSLDGPTSGCWLPWSRAASTPLSPGQRPLAPLTQGARGLHRSRRAQSSPPGRGHRRGLRPHDPRWPPVSAHRGGCRPQGVRGQEPTRAAQAPRARRVGLARRPTRLGRAQRGGAGAGPGSGPPSARGRWPHTIARD